MCRPETVETSVSTLGLNLNEVGDWHPANSKYVEHGIELLLSGSIATAFWFTPFPFPLEEHVTLLPVVEAVGQQYFRKHEIGERLQSHALRSKRYLRHLALAGPGRVEFEAAQVG